MSDLEYDDDDEFVNGGDTDNEGNDDDETKSPYVAGHGDLQAILMKIEKV